MSKACAADHLVKTANDAEFQQPVQCLHHPISRQLQATARCLHQPCTTGNNPKAPNQTAAANVLCCLKHQGMLPTQLVLQHVENEVPLASSACSLTCSTNTASTINAHNNLDNSRILRASLWQHWSQGGWGATHTKRTTAEKINRKDAPPPP